MQKIINTTKDVGSKVPSYYHYSFLKLNLNRQSLIKLKEIFTFLFECSRIFGVKTCVKMTQTFFTFVHAIKAHLKFDHSTYCLFEVLSLRIIQ